MDWDLLGTNRKTSQIISRACCCFRDLFTATDHVFPTFQCSTFPRRWVRQTKTENRWNYVHCVRSREMKVFSFSMSACPKHCLHFPDAVSKWFPLRRSIIFICIMMNEKAVLRMGNRLKCVSAVVEILGLHWILEGPFSSSEIFRRVFQRVHLIPFARQQHERKTFSLLANFFAMCMPSEIKNSSSKKSSQFLDHFRPRRMCHV